MSLCADPMQLRDKENPRRFLFYEVWDDELALQAHMKAPILTSAMPILNAILAEPTEQIRLIQLPGSSL
jgi:quinol monooxygenase YgiN